MYLNWSIADKWEEEANLNKEDSIEPTWSWDCGFKLDFDGPLLRVSSRFYPPAKNAINRWEGNAKILLLDKEIVIKEFECQTLDELKVQVEQYVKDYIASLEKLLINANDGPS